MRRTLARALVYADDADLLGWLEHTDPHVQAAARWALRERP
jgi:isocitrate lyase